MAALLAFLSLVALVPGALGPFMTVSSIGSNETNSLIAGIVMMFKTNHVFLGVVLAVFSVLFPMIKLTALLVGTSSLIRLSLRAHETMHRFAEKTARYSMLDVLVVALLVVIIKSEGLAVVSAGWGTLQFCTSILLSIAAGLCVSFQHLAPQT